MTLEFFIWTVIYIVFILLTLVMLVYLAIKAKKSALLYSFMFVQFLPVLWTLRALLFLVFTSYIQDKNQLSALLEILHWRLGIFVGGFMALGWMIFSLNYVGWKYSKNIRAISLMAAPTVFFFIMALTNGYHRLFMNEYKPGILFGIHAAIAYTYTIVGFVSLMGYAAKHKGQEQKRTVLLIIAYLVPFISNILNEVRIFVLHMKALLGSFDSSPVCFTVGTSIIAFIIYKYRFLNIKTIAVSKIVDNLIQAVIIVDTSNRIISFNHSFLNTFSYGAQIKDDESITLFGEFLQKNTDNNYSSRKVIEMINSDNYEVFNGELKLMKPERRFYDVAIYPILKKGIVHGRIISFDDITQIKGVMEELGEKNDALSDLNHELVIKNEKLRDYASAVEELAVIKERNRFSRDIHDTLGHTLTLLITQLKVISIIFDSEPDKAKEKIKDIINVVKDGLNELRKSISGLRPGKLEEYNLEDSIAKLISDFEAAGMEIDFTVNGASSDMAFENFQVLYRICQEALTNSLRHGKAKHADIVINFIDDRVKVLVKDNGCGCGQLNKGFGLTGMEERVRGLGGYIQYGSDGENGFNIYAELPLKHGIELR